MLKPKGFVLLTENFAHFKQLFPAFTVYTENWTDIILRPRENWVSTEMSAKSQHLSSVIALDNQFDLPEFCYLSNSPNFKNAVWDFTCQTLQYILKKKACIILKMYTRWCFIVNILKVFSMAPDKKSGSTLFNLVDII